ncbi:MAG: cystathionine beta-lyase [Alphaproteobacteria bacterium]|nr:cystathionine beta-lyase [Alphaproteobacteria bacterium]
MRYRIATDLVRAGRNRARNEGGVNPPVHRVSTLILERVDQLYDDDNVKTYGLDGMAVHEALAEALVAIEGGAGVTFAPSGLGACALPFLAFCEAGSHALVPDCVYGPTRRLCDGLLARFGVETQIYDPRIGADIASLFRPNTRFVWMESPGSLTFEVQDVPAITAAARAAGIATGIDNTWSAGLYFKPFAHGVDVSVQALTKYQAGHADVLLGAALARDAATHARLRRVNKELGLGAGGPDDVYLCLRGLRSMPVRLAAQAASALKIATWLRARPEVAQVLHPALPGAPDHDLWARDFTGAAGVFSFVLHPAPEARVTAMLEGYRLLSMGFSWGGYESLIVPCDPQLKRTVARPRFAGPLVRLSIGLEDADDLIADLEEGFARLTGQRAE